MNKNLDGTAVLTIHGNPTPVIIGGERSDSLPRTFDAFANRMRRLLEPTAQGKGYNTTGVDGQNMLYEFVAETVGGPGHAVGEAIYKVKRYAARRNPEDLEKLAAWAFLMWKHHQE